MIAFNIPVKRTAEQVDEKQDRCYLREWWKLKPEASLGGERSGRLYPAGGEELLQPGVVSHFQSWSSPWWEGAGRRGGQ